MQQSPDSGAVAPEFEQRMGALLEEITKAGVMLDTAGLL
ncbi:YciI family protein, partial [Streptomyces virginiae]